jgi:sulfur carrier protein
VQLTINGEKKEVVADAERITIRALVEALGIKGAVAVEVNRTIVPRAEHATHLIGDGDVIEIVHFVGGG